MTPKLSALTLARQNGDQTYIGKICAKHPEEQGLRRTSTRYCVGCHRDATRRSTQRKKEAQLHDNGR